MRKAFTLVELLIVVVVLVTLMSITFRLSSINTNSSARNLTVARIQRLENCLSGYYAAFGSYPPVRVHGSRNYLLDVSDHGIQDVGGTEQELNWGWNAIGDEEEVKDWNKVRAACKSQPVDCRYPFPELGNYGDVVSSYSQIYAAGAGSVSDEKRRAVLKRGFFAGFTGNAGRLSSYKSEAKWEEVQLFKFGLMSFLLPRYLVMMEGQTEFFKYTQWTANNTMPSDPITGRVYNEWNELRTKSISDKKSDNAHVANIPSQAVCARWLPNLEKSCATMRRDVKYFGIRIDDEDDMLLGGDQEGIEIYTPGGYDNDGNGEQYVLDGVTIRDGWDQEFFYYSPAPHQSYVLWSGGPNKRTFPPWVSKADLSEDANKRISMWIEDDIVNMSH